MRLTDKITLVISLGLVLSCNSPKPIPKHIIPPDAMVRVLTDVHLTEGAKTGRKIMGDTLRLETYYQKVFSKHGTSLPQFNKSYAYYTNHPEEMNTIYEKVIENLNRMEIRVPKWEKEELHTLDSTDNCTIKNLKATNDSSDLQKKDSTFFNSR